MSETTIVDSYLLQLNIAYWLSGIIVWGLWFYAVTKYLAKLSK